MRKKEFTKEQLNDIFEKYQNEKIINDKKALSNIK